MIRSSWNLLWLLRQWSNVCSAGDVLRRSDGADLVHNGKYCTEHVNIGEHLPPCTSFLLGVCVGGGGEEGGLTSPPHKEYALLSPKAISIHLTFYSPLPPEKQRTFLSIYSHCPIALSTHLLYYYVASAICPQCPSSHTPCLSVVLRTPLPHAC